MYGVGKIMYRDFVVGYIKKDSFDLGGVKAEAAKVYAEQVAGAAVLVIGSEGDGMSRIVREKCDFIVSLKMKGQINSLNASVAGGILMYEFAYKR